MDKKDALLIFQFSHILWSLLYIFITIFIAYIISKKDINKFVKGVFIIIPIFYSISNLLEILAFYMDIESIRSFFYYNKEYKQSVLNFIPVFSVSLSYFLMITGITFLLFSKQENNTRTDIKLIGRRRKIGLSLLLFIITLGLYFPFWLYRIVKDLKTNFNNEVPYTPTQAVGFLFIPIFNIGWLFYLIFTLPKSIHIIEKKYFYDGIGFSLKPIFISILILAFIIISNLNSLCWNVDNTLGLFIGDQLFFFSAMIYFWIILQAKVNSFFENNVLADNKTLNN